MRWEELFDDLEAQLDAAEAAEFAAEVAERTRGEQRALRLVDRLRPAVGAPIRVAVAAGDAVEGVLAAVGPDWILVGAPAGETLVALAAVTGVIGVGAASAVPGSEGAVAARLGLRSALAGLVRDRAAVEVLLVDGTLVVGTVDRVGADFLELAEHPADEPRRRAAVRRVRLVPLGAFSRARRLG